MRVTSVLLSLAALAPLAFAQDNAGGEAAPAPAAEGGDAGAQAGSGGEAAHKTGSAVGAHSSNTGHGGGTGNQDWVLSTFDVPNRNYYCEFLFHGQGEPVLGSAQNTRTDALRRRPCATDRTSTSLDSVRFSRMQRSFRTAR